MSLIVPAADEPLCPCTPGSSHTIHWQSSSVSRTQAGLEVQESSLRKMWEAVLSWKDTHT